MKEKKLSHIIYINMMMAFFVTAIITTSIGVITNDLIKKGVFSVSALGYVVSARSFGYLLGAYASISAFKKISYLKIVPIYFAIVSILMLALFYKNNLTVLIIVFMIFGLLKNLITVGGNQISAYFYKANIQKSLLNNLQFIYGIGTFISPLCVGYILTASSMSAVICLFVFLSLGTSLLFFATRSSENIIIEQSLANTKTSKKNIILINLFFAVYAGFEIFIGTWGNYIMTTKMHNENLVYWGNAAFWLALAFSKVIIEKFKKIAERQKFIVYFSISLTFIVTLLYMLINGDLIIIIIMFLLGISMGNIVPSTIKYLNDTNKVSSGETAWCFVGAGIGGMIFSKIYSDIFEIGIKYSYIIAFIQLVVILGIFLFLSSNKYLAKEEK